LTKKKAFLFFIVHPSKYHLFKHTINVLISKGHSVDVYYTTKDVLEVLIESENWNSLNIFPEGRNIKGITKTLSTGINLLRTIWRLYFFTRKKKYDLFITDDSLGIIGKIRNVPTFHFADDDLSVISTSSVLLNFATHILAPSFTNLGKYERKTIKFDGYKQSAYLRPRVFQPNHEIPLSFGLKTKKYFIIRLVSLSATHDSGKSGITDDIVLRLISLLEKHGDVIITSERKLSTNLEKYRISVPPKHMLDLLSFSNLLICDSQSMALEAGMLGVPFIRFNDFINEIGVLNKLENEYKLGFGIKSNNQEELFKVVEGLLKRKNVYDHWANRRAKLISETIDLSKFMIWLFENYPTSIEKIKLNLDYQKEFYDEA